MVGADVDDCQRGFTNDHTLEKRFYSQKSVLRTVRKPSFNGTDSTVDTVRITPFDKTIHRHFPGCAEYGVLTFVLTYSTIFHIIWRCFIMSVQEEATALSPGVRQLTHGKVGWFVATRSLGRETFFRENIFGWLSTPVAQPPWPSPSMLFASSCQPQKTINFVTHDPQLAIVFPGMLN